VLYLIENPKKGFLIFDSVFDRTTKLLKAKKKNILSNYIEYSDNSSSMLATSEVFEQQVQQTALN